MTRTLLEVIAETVLDGKVPAKVVAETLGKPYPTLMRELNPQDEGAKLGAEMLIPVMRATGDDRPLYYLAQQMGYRLASLEEVKPDKPTLADECLDTYPALAEFHEAMRNGSSLKKVGMLLHRAISEVEQDFVAYRNRG